MRSYKLVVAMGWSILLIAPEVYTKLDVIEFIVLLSEGIFYSAGTYFFAHDSKRFFHPIWHIFVLLGAMAHWTLVLLLIIK